MGSVYNLHLGKGLLGNGCGMVAELLDPKGSGNADCFVPWAQPCRSKLFLPPPSLFYKKKQLPVQLLLRALICLSVVASPSPSIVSSD